MSDIPVWTCEFQPVSKDGPKLEELTVGAKFVWHCHGDLAVNWDQTSLHLAFAKKEDQYSLAILKVLHQDPNDVQYLVTGYKSGEHKPDFVRVLQGSGEAEKGFEAAKPTWNIQTVLPKDQQPQPYGPVGPWNMVLSIWFWIAIAVALVVITAFIYRRVKKYSQRRRMLEDLKRHTTALMPLHQFYRDARQLRRRMHAAKTESELKDIATDLDREFRLFVLREFQIPTLDWSNRSILEDLRRRHRKVYRAASEPLKKTLRELDKLKVSPQVKSKDLEQMQNMSLETAEKLEKGGQRK